MSIQGSELVSVVVPCFNPGSFLVEALDSLLGQTYKHVEITVIDDGSTDFTSDILNSYRARLQVERQARRGACAARNRGLALSKGKFVLFLDADDVIAPDTIGALVGAASGAPGALAMCEWSFLWRKASDWIASPSGWAPSSPEDDYLKKWLTGWYAPCCALLWPREVLDRVGGWDETLESNQDGDIIMRALLQGVSIVRTSGGHSYYRRYAAECPSVSTRMSLGVMRSRQRVLDKVKDELERSGLLSEYARELAVAYHNLARVSLHVSPSIGRECAALARRLGQGTEISGTLGHRVLTRLLGLENKERLTGLLARLGVSRRSRREFMKGTARAIRDELKPER